MTDSEVATRAPESDQMEEQSLDTPVEPTLASHSPNTASDSAATTGPIESTLHPHSHCTTDRPLVPGQQSSGSITTYQDDISTYISKPADYPQTPAKVLLLLTNGRGIHSINNQLQADLYAQNGFVVVMPDMFGGDPAPNTTTDQVPEPQQSGTWLDTIKSQIVTTSKSFLIDMWLARQTAEKVLPIINKVVDHVKDEFADAVSHGGGIYAAGYCFGGKYVLTLAGERSDSVMKGQDGKEADVEEGMVKTGPQIKCGVVAHGTLVTTDDLKEVRAPVSLVCVGK